MLLSILRQNHKIIGTENQMIYTTEFQLDDKKHEIIPSFSEAYPYACMDVTLDYLIGRTWHWHHAFELDYILEGSMDIWIHNERVHLEKGDAIFINTSVLHKANATTFNMKCRIYAHLFSDQFLCGMYGSFFEEKYIYPIRNCTEFKYYVIHPNAPFGIQMIDTLLKTITINKEEKYGYEFRIRSLLCDFWVLLLEHTEEYRATCRISSGPKSIDSERIKKMLDYIRQHYMEQISMKDIAGAAAISTRECTRCFQKRLSTTPSVFLTSYRINIAAQMLMHSKESVISISEACGFSSPSYFTKIFREVMGTTPKEYRKQQFQY